VGNLRAIRKAAGLSQIQLAQRAKISRFRLSLAEMGSLELREDELRAICDAVAPEIERTARLASKFESRGTATAG
jgi:transcriptional regulator with XRE-family HTH domain